MCPRTFLLPLLRSTRRGVAPLPASPKKKANTTQNTQKDHAKRVLHHLSFHLLRGCPFTEIARQDFGGNPRYFTYMFNAMNDHIMRHSTTKFLAHLSVNGNGCPTKYITLED
jgi:hypothetical protein